MSRSDYWSKVALLLLSGGCLYAPALAGQIASHSTHLSAEQLKQVDQLVTEGIDKEKTRDHKGAMELFNQALMLDRHSYRAYVNRAWSRKEIADYEGAISDYSSAIRLKPNSCWVYVNRGWCYQKLNNNDRAIADFNRAIKINPKYVYAYKHRGALLLKKGDYQGSLNDYNTVVALNPNGDKDLQTYLQPDFFSGGFEENQMKPTPANPPVVKRKVVAAEPTETTGLTSSEAEEVDIAKLNNRAALAIKAGKFKDAIAILEKLAHQNPEYDLARDNLSIAYNNQGLSSARHDPEESMSKFRSSLFYAPSEQTARLNLEQMLKETGKDPKDYKVRMALGDEARDKGDITSAYVEYSEGLRLENKAELRSRLADVCMKLDAAYKVGTTSPLSVAKASPASIFDSSDFATPFKGPEAVTKPSADGAKVSSANAVSKVSTGAEAGTKVAASGVSTDSGAKAGAAAGATKAGTTTDAAIASAKNAMQQSSFSVTLGPKSSTPMTIDSQQIVSQLTKLAQNPQIVSQVSKLTQNFQAQAKNGVLIGKPGTAPNGTAANATPQKATPPKTQQVTVSQVSTPQIKAMQAAVPRVTPPQPVQVAVPQATPPQPVQAAVPQATPPQPVQAAVPQATPPQPVQAAVPQVTPPQPVQAAAPQATPPQPVQAAVPQATPPQPTQKPPTPKESVVAQSTTAQSSRQPSPAVANASTEPERITFSSAFTRLKRGLLIRPAPQSDPQPVSAPQKAAAPQKVAVTPQAAPLAQAALPKQTATPRPAALQIKAPPTQESVVSQAFAAPQAPTTAPQVSVAPLEVAPTPQAAAQPEALATPQPAAEQPPTLALASDTMMAPPAPVKPPEAALLLGTIVSPVDPPPPADIKPSVPPQAVAAVPERTAPESAVPATAIPETAAQPTPSAPPRQETPPDLRKTWKQLISDGDRLYKESKFSEAEQSFKESATMARSLGDSAELVISLDKLAGVLLIQNRNHDAMTSLTQALDVRKRLLPPGHPNIGETENRLNFVRSRVAAH